MSNMTLCIFWLTIISACILYNHCQQAVDMLSVFMHNIQVHKSVSFANEKSKPAEVVYI